MPGSTRRPMPHRTTPRHTAPRPGPAPHHGRLLADGRHCAWLTGIGTRTVTVDVVQWLTGAAADAAYQRDHPDVPGAEAPNGFYIRNANPRLRTLPVRGDAAVAVQQPGGGLRSISFAELPAYLAGDPAPHAGRLWYAPFWVTVRGDRVISIVEQYLP